MDQKTRLVKRGHVIVKIEDSYKYRGAFIVSLSSTKQKGDALPFVFDDQLDDAIKALKRARNRIFWIRLMRIVAG